jgi:hypothetical protein
MVSSSISWIPALGIAVRYEGSIMSEKVCECSIEHDGGHMLCGMEDVVDAAEASEDVEDEA